MGSSKPKPMQTPFQQQQQQTNTFGTYSIGDTPEAQNFLGVPLDYGQGAYSGEAYKDIPTEFDIDPGVGRRTDLAEQGVSNRYNSAFMSGVPSWIREINRNKELREVQERGAYERQQAEYGRGQLRTAAATQRAQMRDAAELQKAGMAGRATEADLARRERLLPQILQTGGSGTASGYGTQIVQPQPGFWQRLALTAVGGASSLPRFGVGG